MHTGRLVGKDLAGPYQPETWGFKSSYCYTATVGCVSKAFNLVYTRGRHMIIDPAL